MTRADKIEACNSLTQRQFGYLQRCVIEKMFLPGEEPVCDIMINLIDDAPHATRKLQMRFVRATNIKLGNVNPMLKIHLTLYDIALRGLEAEKIRVVDEEEGVFSFSCLDVEFFVRPLL